MIFDSIKRWMGGNSDGDQPGGGGDGQGDGEMISCEDALNRIYEYMDGELDQVSSEQVKAHFDVCAGCYPHLASEHSFRRALKRAVEGKGAPQGLKNRIVELLEQAGGSPED